MLNLEQFKSFKTDPEAALADYYERGFHLERDVVPKDVCDDLIERSAALPSAQNNEFRPAMMPHRSDDAYLGMMRHPFVVDVMKRLLGGAVCGLQTEFFYCRPGTKGFALHQDNFFVEAPDGCFGSAWMALTDITPDMGALTVYPGSHKYGRLPVRPLTGGSGDGQDPNASNEETVLENAGEGVVAAVPRGTVIFLNGWVAHSSSFNVSDRNRYALLCTYIRKGAPFRPGNYARREAVEVEEFA